MAELAGELAMKIVSSWRIQTGDPSGLTMWFDPACEVPLLGILPPEQREKDAELALCQVQMELGEGGGGGRWGNWGL